MTPRSASSRSSQPLVAWDIETCPLPLDTLSLAQHHRLAKEVKRQMEQDSTLSEEEASWKAR